MRGKKAINYNHKKKNRTCFLFLPHPRIYEACRESCGVPYLLSANNNRKRDKNMTVPRGYSMRKSEKDVRCSILSSIDTANNIHLGVHSSGPGGRTKTKYFG